MTVAEWQNSEKYVLRGGLGLVGRLDGLESSSMIPMVLMVRGLLKLECQWVPQSEFGAA